MSFKLSQLIEDDEYIIWWIFKKNFFLYFELMPFANLGIENL